MATYHHAQNVVNTFPAAIGAAASVGGTPDAIGCIVGFSFMWWATETIDAIMNPNTDDDNAMELDQRVIDTLGSRIEELHRRSWMMNIWELAVKKGEDYATPAKFYRNGATIWDVRDTSIKIYKELLDKLPALRSSIEKVQNKELEESRAAELRASYNTYVRPYHLWDNNVREMVIREDAMETTMTADQQDEGFVQTQS